VMKGRGKLTQTLVLRSINAGASFVAVLPGN
jgi:hypothetical protein